MNGAKSAFVNNQFWLDSFGPSEKRKYFIFKQAELGVPGFQQAALGVCCIPHHGPNGATKYIIVRLTAPVVIHRPVIYTSYFAPEEKIQTNQTD